MIVDAGPLVAAANRKDDHHSSSVKLLRETWRPMIVPSPVVAEVCHLLERDAGSRIEAQFIRSLADGHLILAELTKSDLYRMAELVERYADLGLGGVDASVVAVAERLRETDVATLDRRHFSVVRPRHVERFTLLPR